MKSGVKKYVIFSGVLSLVLIFGTFQSLDISNFGLASLNSAKALKKAATENIDGARINPLYADDEAVSGIFNSRYQDVYAYVYVNESFKAFKRIPAGNVFIVELHERLKANDSVHVNIDAFNSKYKFSSPSVTVLPRSGDMPQVVKDFYIGEFKLDKELKAGDQSIAATFSKKYNNVFVNIYVDGKYVGGRQFKNGNYFKVNLRNPLKVGNKVEIKVYSYKTRTVMEGEAIVES